CMLACILVFFSFLTLFSFPSISAFRYLHSFPTRRSSDLGVCTRIIAKEIGNGFRLVLRFCIWYGRRRFGSFRTLGRCHIYTIHLDRKSTRLYSSHVKISYAVFCLKKNTPHTRSAASSSIS